MTENTTNKTQYGFSDNQLGENQRNERKRPNADDEVEPGINRYTKLPYSQQYYTILETRRQLPAWSARKNFIKLLRRNQVLILVGETGSGKTTQIPQFVVEAKLNQGLQVAITQPRRVAAMSVATRVAEEMDVTLGETVGYSIRFEDCTSKNTLIKFMTDGMLLREAINDPMLSKYGVIMLDEAHERTIATDVLFGLIKEIAANREDLKVVVMSATLDGKKFQKYLGGADMLTIPGRTFPVEIFYTAEPQRNYLDAVYTTVINIHQNEEPGDILVFLTGEDEIKKVQQRLQHAVSSKEKQMVVVTLYGSMEPREQAQVFKPVEGRKCVLATNIAETSLTIDGIVYVVDTGFSKQNVYNPRARVESLLVAPISQASAAQRAGRAGRTRPGKCFRLYTEEAFKKELIPQTFPEILRSNIATVVLNLKKLGIDDLVHFDFMDPPAPETMMRALEELNYLGALDDEGELTKTGELMGEFPLEPQLAKTLVSAPKFGCTRDIVAVVAMLSVPNVFLRPNNKVEGIKHSAMEPAASLRSHRGDHITFLNVFNAYQEVAKQGKTATDIFCRKLCANGKALDSAVRVFEQLRKLTEKHLAVTCPIEMQKQPDSDAILRCMCTGFFLQVATLTRSGYCTVKDNQNVGIHPSSVLSGRGDWVVFHQVVHTSKTFIRTVSEVQPLWLLQAAPDYFDPSEIPNKEIVAILKRTRELYKDELRPNK
ncbi:putative pre-mRNA-splicing factor ATP-dependent RNA helicase DEAH2 [Babesia sp. Xinjiang]|uniref:putative pre-mRNA-splicing factor ATP-dependent RNA helicase DEAH2 n=1 Tax=Babesia sp. Xinjiang TaxID=462227 RepID=UPI000A264262|nr:putative pre-mRNA-splicing factor ATP-dependent RNA helicase DEAH2 [Babesia sp. Xinjiang]ORM40288.1 putative pre-mRNA-splicing factor ATP-dependent RNA helicase DEAH2 [Babesia sp. Xinjiang]